MHIRTTRQAVAPGGGIVPANMVLDLPEAEALPMIEAGDAVSIDQPAPAAPEQDKGESEG